jgi:uncharacterized membrane protein
MKKGREQSLPEARKEGIVTQRLADEVLIYDQQRHKAHCLNQTATLVWERCDGKTTAAEIAEQISRQTRKEVGEEVALLAIEELRRSRLLKQESGRSEAVAGVSRRELIKRAGIAAAIALPVVTSIVAPKAAHAASCRATGVACTTSAQCCSQLCNAGVCA